MRSHLTRNVCRRLLAGQALQQPCLAVFSRALLMSRHRSIPMVVRRSQRRTFFGLFSKPPREFKEIGVDPGYLTLIQFSNMKADQVRLPRRDELLKGFRDFFRYKRRYRKPPNTTQAHLALTLLRHLVATESEGEPFEVEELRDARDVVLLFPPGLWPSHAMLSNELWEEIRKRQPFLRENSFRSSEGQKVLRFRQDGAESYDDFKRYLSAMTRFGESKDAVKALDDYLAAASRGRDEAKMALPLWALTLEGLAREGEEEELIRQFEKSQHAQVPYSPIIHEIMFTFFADRDRVEETKAWFSKPIEETWGVPQGWPTPHAFERIVRFARRNGEKHWARPIFKDLINSDPPKPHWDVYVQWLLLTEEKGADRVRTEIEHRMTHTSAEKLWSRPDAGTINRLVEAAIERQDPYLAERIISVSLELGIELNWKTFLLQMGYRIDADDFTGAIAIYQKLENGEFQVQDDEDLPVLNKYLRYICARDVRHLEHVLEVLSFIEQRGATLEPETVVAVCNMFLKCDKPHEVIDTLSLHTVQMSLEEREQVSDALVAYCLDLTNSTARVWDGYSLLRQFFPDTPRAQRVRLMETFFKRKRPDMATFVFGHMRGHESPGQRPTADIYVQFLVELGRHPDLESLKIVHNMLKMDTTIVMDAKLYNALMLAYVGCEEAYAAWDFWREINRLPEGPTYNSLAIAFRVCEALPFGDRKARPIWQKLERLDLEIPPHVFSAYCGAIASSGSVEEVKRLIQGMYASMGYLPNLMTLGISYNALPGDSHREMFSEWAKSEYPDMWARLESKGRKQRPMGGDEFRIFRDLPA